MARAMVTFTPSSQWATSSRWWSRTCDPSCEARPGGWSPRPAVRCALIGIGWHMIWKGVLFALVALAAATPANAQVTTVAPEAPTQVVHLTDGSVLRGAVVEMKDGVVLLRTANGTLSIPQESIVRIEISPSEMPAASPSPSPVQATLEGATPFFPTETNSQEGPVGWVYPDQVVATVPDGTDIGNRVRWDAGTATWLRVESLYRVIGEELGRSESSPTTLFSTEKQARPRYLLGGNIVELSFANAERTSLTSARFRSRVVVRWQVYDSKLKRVIFAREAEGAGTSNSMPNAVENATRDSVRSLVGHKDFISFTTSTPDPGEPGPLLDLGGASVSSTSRIPSAPPRFVKRDPDIAANVFLGARSVDAEYWAPFQSIPSYGVEFTYSPKGIPIALAVDAWGGTATKAVGATEIVASVFEVDAGARKIFKIRGWLLPSIGAGAAIVRADYSATSASLGGDDEQLDGDTVLGGWVSAGLAVRPVEMVTVGVTVRYTSAQVELFGERGEAGGLFGGVMAGIAFGRY